MKTLRAATMVASLALVACGNDNTEPGQPGSFQVLGTAQSACKAESKSDASPSFGTLKAEAQGSSVLISHEDARYNCASKLKLDASLSSSEILVKEQITNPAEVARCTCDYDLSVELKGLADGGYTVKLLDAEGQLVGTASVTIGSSSGLQVAAKQSACKANPPESYVAGDLKASVSGVLLVSHEDARYNCASKVEMRAALKGQTIVVQETITNPGEMAFCTCDFDLSVEVRGLAAGSYTLQVFDADGQLVGTIQIVIP
jgi:hypothetical protein